MGARHLRFVAIVALKGDFAGLSMDAVEDDAGSLNVSGGGFDSNGSATPGKVNFASCNSMAPVQPVF